MRQFNDRQLELDIGVPSGGETDAGPVRRRKKLFVRDLREGQDLGENDPAGEVFLVTEKGLRTTQAGRKYLAAELADRTGRIQARAWDNAEALSAGVSAGDLAVVSGRVESFGGQLEIKVASLRAISDEEADLSDFLPATRRDAAEMEAELGRYLELIRDALLRALVSACLDPSRSETGRLFRTAPAAKQLHHATIGGLFEHTLSVAGLCLAIANHYRGSLELDLDLLLAGALLHDIGKVREYTWSRGFDYSDEGRLVGHLVIGAELVTQRAAEIPGFPPERLMCLKHMILSHHGQYEWGSPKRPKFPEALALHFADDLDGKLNMVDEFLRSERERDPASRFTSYHRVLERYLYKGPKAGPGTEPDRAYP